LSESPRTESEAPGGSHASSHAEQGRQERGKLVARAGVVGLGTLASRVLGLGRDVALAAIFDRDAMDAWWVAFTIPNSLRSLLAEGAVTSAVVPVLSEKLALEGDVAAKRFFARIRGASLLALLVVSVLGVLFAHPITDLFADGYKDRPGEFERTVDLTRVVFPYIFFMGTAALGMAALNANRRFAVAAFAPGLLNVALLAAAFAAATMHGPVQWLAWGALAGGALQVVAQWPALRGIGYAGLPSLAFDPDVRKVLRRIAPLMFGTGVYYVDLVVCRRFLSELGPGAQSYFAWAMRLCDFPQGIFVMALSTAALPSLSTLAAKGAKEELAKTWAHGLGLAMFVAIPASAALIAMPDAIVATLFQRGAFDAVSVRETARALVWQGGAIWTVAAVRQTVPAFYALGDTRTPVIVSALDLSALVVLAVALRGSMGHAGISAAVAGSSAVQMVLLLVGLRRRMGTLRGGDLARSVSRTLVSSVVAGIAGWGAARLAGGAPGMLAFAVVFLLAAYGLRAPELLEISGALRRRLVRRR
jgi:putative peptidoglycan lipid II flippase